MKETFSLPSSDRIHTLHGLLVLPEGEVRGLLQIVHGMAEHIGRYEPLMQEMARAGFACFGCDHLGHGLSAAPEERGFFAPRDGWKRLVDDEALIAKAARARFGESLPFALLGHSMGSFIARLAALPIQPDKLLIVGTGGPNPAAPFGLALIRLIRLFRKDTDFSPLVEKLAFGAYNSRCAQENDPFAWLSRDPQNRANYAADPLCGFPFTVSAMEDLVRLNRECNKASWFSALPADLPIALFAGEEDPVGDWSRGVKKVAARLEKTGHHPELHLYPGCRHEILNDDCSAQVQADIRAFLLA